jgi:hypothetical protein
MIINKIDDTRFTVDLINLYHEAIKD